MKLLLTSVLILVLLTACDNPAATERPVFDPVSMVTPSAPWSYEEKGVTARAEGDYIQVEWHKPASSLYFRRYELERTSEVDLNQGRPINFEKIAEITSYYDTLYVDTTGILLNKNYFYRVAVVNVDDKYSEYSDTAYYRLGPKPQVLSVFSETTDTTKNIIFSIDIVNQSFPQPVYLRIYRQPEESRIIISELDPSRFWESGNGIAEFDLTDLLDVEDGREVSIRTDIIESGKIRLSTGSYQVRVDYVGQELYHSGAKSGWVQFNY